MPRFRWSALTLPTLLTLFAVAACSLGLDTNEFAGGDVEADGGAVSVVPSTDGGVDPKADAIADAASEDSADAALDPALVAWWPLDETSGTVAHDRSNHGHDGLISGGSFVAGHASGGALALSGGAVTAAGSPEFNRPTGTAFSITLWMKPLAALSHNLLFSVSYGASGAMFGLEAKDDSHVNYFDGETDAGSGVAHVATTQVPIAIGAWSHLGLVVDNGQVRIYFDGVKIGVGVADQTPRVATQVLLGSSNYGDHLAGVLEDVRFYSRALSDIEIAADRDR